MSNILKKVKMNLAKYLTVGALAATSLAFGSADVNAAETKNVKSESVKFEKVKPASALEYAVNSYKVKGSTIGKVFVDKTNYTIAYNIGEKLVGNESESIHTCYVDDAKIVGNVVDNSVLCDFKGIEYKLNFDKLSVKSTNGKFGASVKYSSKADFEFVNIPLKATAAVVDSIDSTVNLNPTFRIKLDSQTFSLLPQTPVIDSNYQGLMMKSDTDRIAENPSLLSVTRGSDRKIRLPSYKTPQRDTIIGPASNRVYAPNEGVTLNQIPNAPIGITHVERETRNLRLYPDIVLKEDNTSLNKANSSTSTPVERESVTRVEIPQKLSGIEEKINVPITPKPVTSRYVTISPEESAKMDKIFLQTSQNIDSLKPAIPSAPRSLDSTSQSASMNVPSDNRTSDNNFKGLRLGLGVLNIQNGGNRPVFSIGSSFKIPNFYGIDTINPNLYFLPKNNSEYSSSSSTRINTAFSPLTSETLSTYVKNQIKETPNNSFGGSLLVSGPGLNISGIKVELGLEGFYLRSKYTSSSQNFESLTNLAGAVVSTKTDNISQQSGNRNAYTLGVVGVYSLTDNFSVKGSVGLTFKSTPDKVSNGLPSNFNSNTELPKLGRYFSLGLEYKIPF